VERRRFELPLSFGSLLMGGRSKSARFQHGQCAKARRRNFSVWFFLK
jgi:hypothetical protein